MLVLSLAALWAGVDGRVFGRGDDPDAWAVRDVEMPRGWQE